MTNDVGSDSSKAGAEHVLNEGDRVGDRTMEIFANKKSLLIRVGPARNGV